jgi:hypothetical protein
VNHPLAELRNFVEPGYRHRIDLLVESERGRERLRRERRNTRRLDPRYSRKLTPEEDWPTELARLLRECGAPDNCILFLANEDEVLELPLDEAASRVGNTFGAFIVWISGRLGYFEGESIGDRYLLERKP